MKGNIYYGSKYDIIDYQSQIGNISVVRVIAIELVYVVTDQFG